MTVTDDTRLRGATRWSMAARCARMSAYGLLGEQPEEPDETTQLRWVRGKMDETWWIENHLQAKHGEENVIREKAVPWPAEGLPAGELHEDAFVVTEGMPYEIKSHLDGDPMDSDFLQLKGALHFDQDVKEKVGALIVIDRDLKWEALPVFLRDEDIEEVEQRAADVIRAGKTRELPARVCEKPADARGRMCPFAEVCFAGWERPDPLHLDGDIALVALDLMHAQTRAAAAAKLAKELDAEKKAIAERLTEWDLVPGLEYSGAGVRVKRTHVDATEKLSLKNLRDAGALTDELDTVLRPFITASGEHDRWKITPVDEIELDEDDFGEAPF